MPCLFFDLVLRFGALPAVRAFQKVDELLLHAGELLRFERDEIDRALERAFVHLEGEQRAVLDLLLHGECREHGDAHAAGDHLFYPQLGVKLCSMAGGGVQKIYMVFLREPSRRDRSGSDLFHLWDGFEIKMNFDRNVSCFIFVNALMHDDFFD